MRRFLVVLFALVMLLLVGLAVFLVPAHLQVRRVEPVLPTETELLALTAIPHGPTGIHYINTSTQKLPQGKLGHSVFIIEWADGKRFMIDAGMDEATAIEFGKLMESALGAKQAVSHGNIAELLGDGIQQVSGLGFTHLHIDHTQGVLPFCQFGGTDATAYQTRWQKELQNFNTEDGAHIVANSCLEQATLGSEGLLSIESYPGLGIVALGGHTPGSTLFAVPVDGTLWLLSGDTTNTRADLLNNIGKGFLYSYLLVPENTTRTEQLRLWFTALDARDDMKVIVSHDLAQIETSGMPEYKTKQAMVIQ